MWLTNPVYGSEYGNRPMPVLPNQVYRFDLKDSSIRAMADGSGRSNGIAFSVGQKTLYVGDIGALFGNGNNQHQCSKND
jgi:gluconolactonase